MPGSLGAWVAAHPFAVRLALAALVALACASRRIVDVNRLTLRVDWVGGLLALLVVALLLAAGRRIPWSAPLAGLAAFVGAEVVAAVANAAAWPRGFRFLVIYLLAMAYVLAVLLLVQDRATARFALTAAVVVAAAQGAIGTVTLLVRNTLAMPSGTFSDLGLQYPYQRARAFMIEPNLFASLLLAPFAIALWRWGREPRWAWPHAIIVGALCAGLVCALTRIAWIVALALTVIWVWRARPGAAKAAFVAGVAAVTLLAVLLSEIPMTRGDLRVGAVYRQIVWILVKKSDPAVAGRVMEIRTGLDSARQHPVVGHGPGAANRLEQYVMPGVRRARGWIANGPMFVFHEAGALGLLAAALTVIAAALACRTAARRTRDPADRADHEALALGLAGVLVAWQATHGLWQMYGYMLFGLLLALHAIAAREARSAAPGPA